MARVNVDAIFFTDVRVKRLAHLSKESKWATRGRLVTIWHHCYSHITEFITEEDLGALLDWFDEPSYCALLIKCGLAEKAPKGLRIHGVQDRIGYLERAREAGKKSGVVRRRLAEGTFVEPSKVSEHIVEPLALALALAPDNKTKPATLGGDQPRVRAYDPLDPPSEDRDQLIFDTVAAYSDEYQKRYQQKPRVEGTETIFAKIVDHLGPMAPRVAAHYVWVTQKNRFYERKAHAIKFLLDDIDKIAASLRLRDQKYPEQVQP